MSELGFSVVEVLSGLNTSDIDIVTTYVAKRTESQWWSFREMVVHDGGGGAVIAS